MDPSPLPEGLDLAELKREELGRLIYLALYGHQGAIWAANESKEVWYAAADRLFTSLSEKGGLSQSQPCDVEPQKLHADFDAEPSGARDPTRLPARDLTDAELRAEQGRVEKLWDSMFEPDEDGEVFEGHGGSPGEWMVERMDEIATEQRRREASPSPHQPGGVKR